MQDGRKSFRQIAKEIGVSTPTVESHFSRMMALRTIWKNEKGDNVKKMNKWLKSLLGECIGRSKHPKKNCWRYR